MSRNKLGENVSTKLSKFISEKKSGQSTPQQSGLISKIPDSVVRAVRLREEDLEAFEKLKDAINRERSSRRRVTDSEFIRAILNHASEKVPGKKLAEYLR